MPYTIQPLAQIHPFQRPLPKSLQKPSAPASEFRDVSAMIFHVLPSFQNAWRVPEAQQQARQLIRTGSLLAESEFFSEEGLQMSS